MSNYGKASVSIGIVATLLFVFGLFSQGMGEGWFYLFGAILTLIQFSLLVIDYRRQRF